MQEEGQLAKAGNPQLSHHVTFNFDEFGIGRMEVLRWRTLRDISEGQKAVNYAASAKNAKFGLDI